MLHVHIKIVKQIYIPHVCIAMVVYIRCVSISCLRNYILVPLKNPLFDLNIIDKVCTLC